MLKLSLCKNDYIVLAANQRSVIKNIVMVETIESRKEKRKKVQSKTQSKNAK